MLTERLHDWQVTPHEAVEIQRSLADRVLTEGEVRAPRLIAGVDIAVDHRDKTGTAAVVVLSYPDFEVMETRRFTGTLNFPYVPGLLSFREVPLLLPAFERLELIPDLVLVDGQGYAHPRRMGIACHLGLILDIPTIGCAKSRLCGRHAEPGRERGASAPVLDDDGVIGAALRTRSGVKPIYVSIGHRISLDQAIFWTLACSRGFRIPEATRLAHIAAHTEVIPA